LATQAHTYDATRLARLRGRVRVGRALGLALIALIVLFMTAYPLVLMLVKSFQTSQPYEHVTWGVSAWKNAFSDASLPRAIGNTLILGLCRVGIAAVIGIAFAWVVTRTNVPFKRFLEVSMWLGFFLPALPMAFGWMLLLDGQSGLFNRFLRWGFHVQGAPLDLHSYWGIVWVQLATATSIMFLLVSPAFRRMDASLEEAAWVGGHGRVRTLLRITLPLLAPAIMVATVLVLMRSLESFEIELVLGVPARIYVYSTQVWLYLRTTPPRYGVATALSVLFLALLLSLIVVQQRFLRKRQFTTVSGRGFRAEVGDLGRWRWPVFAACAGFIAVMIFLPLGLLVLSTFMRVFGFFDLPNPWTLAHWGETFHDPDFMNALKNTIFLGVGSAAVAAILYSVIGYVLVRGRFRGRGTLDFLTWLPWALPGILISLALLWVFLGSGAWLVALYGTIFVLILAMVIKELPFGTQTMKAAFLQVNPELEDASRVAGHAGLSTFRRVLLPIVSPAALAVALIVFVGAAREIPTVFFLASNKSTPLALMMLNVMENGDLERASVIGLIITVVVVVAAFASILIGRRYAFDRETE
jgi:iron(III) transport system permease protein